MAVVVDDLGALEHADGIDELLSSLRLRQGAAYCCDMARSVGSILSF